MIEELFIDGLRVLVSTSIYAGVSDYTVYNNKIYRIVASEGSGLKRSVKLERELSKEEFWLTGVKLGLVVSPTGYIRI